MKTQEILTAGYLLGYMQKVAVFDAPESPDGAVKDEDFDPEDAGLNVMNSQGGKTVSEKLNTEGSDNQPIPNQDPDNKYAAFLASNKTPLQKTAGLSVPNESVFGPDPSKKKVAPKVKNTHNFMPEGKPATEPVKKQTPEKQFYNPVAPTTGFTPTTTTPSTVQNNQQHNPRAVQSAPVSEPIPNSTGESTSTETIIPNNPTLAEKAQILKNSGRKEGTFMGGELVREGQPLTRKQKAAQAVKRQMESDSRTTPTEPFPEAAPAPVKTVPQVTKPKNDPWVKAANGTYVKQSSLSSFRNKKLLMDKGDSILNKPAVKAYSDRHSGSKPNIQNIVGKGA